MFILPKNFREARAIFNNYYDLEVGGRGGELRGSCQSVSVLQRDENCQPLSWNSRPVKREPHNVYVISFNT